MGGWDELDGARRDRFLLDGGDDLAQLSPHEQQLRISRPVVQALLDFGERLGELALAAKGRGEEGVRPGVFVIRAEESRQRISTSGYRAPS